MNEWAARAITAPEPEPKAVAESQGGVSQLDALLVSEPPREGAAAETPADTARSGRVAAYAHAAGFKVRYSVGFVTAEGVRWTLTGADDEAEAVAALRERAEGRARRRGTRSRARGGRATAS
jgi:hypothetical protein